MGLTLVIEPHALRLRVQNLLRQAVQVVGHRAARAGDELALVRGFLALMADIAAVLRAAPHSGL